MANLIWLRYRGPLAEFGYSKYLIILFFWYALAAYQACLASQWVFWQDVVKPKYKPWLEPNAPDMPLKHTRKVRLVINSIFM